MTRAISTIFCACIFANAANLHAAMGMDEEALTRAFGDEDFITIATGKQQLISQAPAVASVITADDIRRMGATDLDQVLETVPGLHVSVAPRGYSPIYSIRGIYSENNPQVLILINGVPITNLYIGNRNDVWGGMPINNISRIEVIRGPGSALYGADAFAGTINIITKTSEDIDGSEIGARAGSFNTREGWVLHGGNWNNLRVAFSLEMLQTDGQDEIIEADAQTVLDTAFGTNASLAPGQVNLDRKVLETRMDISSGDWRLRLGYQGRRNVGMGAGVALALDPTGSGDSHRFNTDLTYDTALTRNLDLTGQLSYFDTSAKPDLTLFPAGHFNPLSGDIFPEGMIASPYIYERHYRFGLSGFYHGIQNHNIRLGIGAVHGEIYKVEERKNYGPFFNNLGSVVDASNDPDLVFMQPHDRSIFYAFAQDEWTLAADWKLTGGVRYDHYSDFGDTTNPRLALVWNTRHDLTTKLLYGRAFRAPSFSELYNINNPVAQGNEDLKPETINTYELAFNYEYSTELQMGLNIFHYRMNDVIRFLPSDTGSFQATNSDAIEGHGLELEARYYPSDDIRIIGNYAFQHSTDKGVDSRVANTPQHQVYLRTHWDFIRHWSLNAQLNWISTRHREPADSRDDIDDYLITDLTLRYRPDTSAWEFAVSGKNIFDEDAREPSPRLDFGPGNPPLIPNDLPLAGRHFFVEARYHFD